MWSDNLYRLIIIIIYSVCAARATTSFDSCARAQLGGHSPTSPDLRSAGVPTRPLFAGRDLCAGQTAPSVHFSGDRLQEPQDFCSSRHAAGRESSPRSVARRREHPTSSSPVLHALPFHRGPRPGFSCAGEATGDTCSTAFAWRSSLWRYRGSARRVLKKNISCINFIHLRRVKQC